MHFESAPEAVVPQPSQTAPEAISSDPGMEVKPYVPTGPPNNYAAYYGAEDEKDADPPRRTKILGLPVAGFWILVFVMVLVVAGAIGGGIGGGLSAKSHSSRYESHRFQCGPFVASFIDWRFISIAASHRVPFQVQPLLQPLLRPPQLHLLPPFPQHSSAVQLQITRISFPVARTLPSCVKWTSLLILSIPRTLLQQLSRTVLILAPNTHGSTQMAHAKLLLGTRTFLHYRKII
jgi:hypothetical protein